MGSMEKTLAELDVLERLHRLPDAVALTTSEAAVFLRSSVSALEAMRAKGAGPTYLQAGVRGAAGSNQKCLYEKADLLAWMRSNKVASTVEAAVRKGQLFMNIFDIVRAEAFWMDSNHAIVDMVERAVVSVAVARLGIYDIEWLPVVDAVAAKWLDPMAHQAMATQVEAILAAQIGRTQAAVEATELARAIDG
jgi:hypothetical protein